MLWMELGAGAVDRSGQSCFAPSTSHSLFNLSCHWALDLLGVLWRQHICKPGVPRYGSRRDKMISASSPLILSALPDHSC